jgi:hypothetical protein
VLGAESNSLHPPAETKPELLGSASPTIQIPPLGDALGIVCALDLGGLISG